MKKLIYISLFFMLSCNSAIKVSQNKSDIDIMLTNWHKAAANANFADYFDAMTSDAIFIGTDATENWNKKAFETFAKPYFDQGKTWNFTPLERHIYFSANKKTAWFDELLSTQMKICRGSGVLVNQKGIWKIKHYVLSMTIPNDKTNEVVKIKTPIEDILIEKLNEK